MTMLHGFIMILFAFLFTFVDTVFLCAYVHFMSYDFFFREVVFFFKNNCDLSIVFKTEESGISVFSLFSSAMMILLKTFLRSELLFPF